MTRRIHILGAILGVAQADGADQIDQFAEPLFVERRSGEILRQRPFEIFVVAFDGDHRLVDQFSDLRLFGLAL